MGSHSNHEPNSLDCSQNGSKDKEPFLFFIKAALTFSSLSDRFFLFGFLAGFTFLQEGLI